MKRRSNVPIWLLILLLIALFLLSVLAPREWQSIAIAPIDTWDLPPRATTELEPPFSSMPASPNMGSELPSATTHAPASRTDRTQITARSAPPVVSKLAPDPLPDWFQPLSPDDVQTLVSSAGSGNQVGPRETALARLDQFAAPMRMATAAPEVTRQYVASPSQNPVLDAVVPPSPATEPVRPTPLILQPRQSQTAHLGPDSNVHVLTTISRQSAAIADPLEAYWPYPKAIAISAKSLAQYDECNAWSSEVLKQLQRLPKQTSLASAELADINQQLHELAALGNQLARESANPVVRSSMGRTAFAIERRLDIWDQIQHISSFETRPVAIRMVDAVALQDILHEVSTRLDQVEHTRLWREYLLLDEAQQQITGGPRIDTAKARDLAKRILLRLDHDVLNSDQRAFLTQSIFSDFSEALQRIATEPVDYFRLLHAIEKFEVDMDTDAALHLAAAQQMLRWSYDEQVQELGQRLHTNFRNANLRISVSTDLLNRFMPGPAAETTPIREVIGGARTQGCSETTTHLGLRLIPSKHSWCFELLAEGSVYSDTRSARGPAVFHSRGESVFLAEKQVVVNREGLQEQSAIATAASDATLTNVETTLDPLPVVREIAQFMAIQQYELQASDTRWEIQNRVAGEVRNRLDEQVARRLGLARDRFLKHIHVPLERLALNPIAIQLETTNDEFITRYRLAGHHQLAAHTPRPIAPTDAVFTIQVHDSALNNVIDQLGWQGRRATLHELHAEIGSLFSLENWAVPQDLPEDVRIRFAETNPLRLSFHDGRASLEIALAELAQGRNRWRNIMVRVHYRHDPEQPQVDLVRDQYVELIGNRLSFRDQIALRGIFSRVFARSQPIDVISRRLQSDPRLAGLELSQLAIGDSWLGIALSPASEGLTAASQVQPAESVASKDGPASIFWVR